MRFTFPKSGVSFLLALPRRMALLLILTLAAFSPRAHGQGPPEWLWQMPGNSHWVWAVAYAPDGRTLATGSQDRTVRLWDAQTGALLGEKTNTAGIVRRLVSNDRADKVIVTTIQKLAPRPRPGKRPELRRAFEAHQRRAHSDHLAWAREVPLVQFASAYLAPESSWFVQV